MSLLSRIAHAASAGVNAVVDAWGAPVSSGSHATSVSAAVDAPASLTRTEAYAHPAPASERDPAVLGNRLTPGLLSLLLAQRNQGHLQPWIDLGGEFLQKNPHLASQLGLRRDSVVETAFAVKPGQGTNRRAAKKAADACAAMLTRWQSRTEASWYDVVGQLVLAVWWQRSAHEVMWARDGREVTIDHLAWVHPRRLSFAAPPGDPDPHALRLHDPDDPTGPFGGFYGTPLSVFHPDKFLVHTVSPLGLQPTCDGLFAGCVWHLLMYEWTFRDLMALIELLGRPGVVGYYNAGGAKAAAPAPGVTKLDGGRVATDAEIERLRRAVHGASGALREVLADTTRVEPLRFDQRATPLQLEALGHLERLLSKLINYGDSVSDLRPGARAALQVQYAQSFSAWRPDVRRVCGAVSWLFERYVRANPQLFPANTPAPVLWSPDLESSRGQSTNPTEKDPNDAPAA